MQVGERRIPLASERAVELVLNQVDDQGVETLGRPVGQVLLGLGFRQGGNDRPGGVAVDQEGPVILVDQVPTVRADFEGKSCNLVVWHINYPFTPVMTMP